MLADQGYRYGYLSFAILPYASMVCLASRSLNPAKEMSGDPEASSEVYEKSD